MEALLLLGVHVRAGHLAVGRELQLELEQRAVGVLRRAQELDALAADRVVDDLSAESHCSLLRFWGEQSLRFSASSCRRPQRRFAVSVKSDP